MGPLPTLGQGRLGWAAQAHNLDVSQASGHLVNFLRDPSIYGGASRAGILKETSCHPGWVSGSRPPRPQRTRQVPQMTWQVPHRLLKIRVGTPKIPRKHPPYRAPNSEDQVDPPGYPDSGGGGPDQVPGQVPDRVPGSTLPARGEVPPDEVLKALHIVNVEGMGYIEVTQGQNGTIVKVPVDPVYLCFNGPIISALMVPLSLL